MNTIKAQKEIFACILEDKKYPPVRGFWIDGGARFAVTGDGYHGFIFRKDQIAFDTEKVKPCNDFLRVHEVLFSDNELKKTRLLYTERMRGVTSAIFEGKNGKTYINRSFLSCFSSDATYYQSKPNTTVFVEEYGEIVGFVLPIRHTEEEGK